ncbi:solute carrier family 25 member 38 [Microdochium nivale]|nr:solute carrier family 25 member 38 [Microdochium nivale]
MSLRHHDQSYHKQGRPGRHSTTTEAAHLETVSRPRRQSDCTKPRDAQLPDFTHSVEWRTAPPQPRQLKQSSPACCRRDEASGTEATSTLHTGAGDMSQSNRSNATSSKAFHFVAGLGSGIFGAVLLQPIDLLKTRVQQSGSSSIRSSFREIAASPNALRAFWRGTAPSALRTGIGSAIYFTTLNTLRQQAALISAGTSSNGVVNAQQHSSSLPKLSNTSNMITGASARAFAGFILMPLTVIKVRYESNLYSYRSILGAARDIYRVERLPGFFVGFGATALRDAPYAGLYVLTYEQFKRRLSKLYPTTTPDITQHQAAGSNNKDMASSRSATINFASGALAGATCSFISNPFDAVKTRIQLRPREYRNMWQACRRMVAEDGFRSLYDGLALRMTRKAVSSALAWMLYEEFVSRAQRTWGGGSKALQSGGEVRL